MFAIYKLCDGQRLLRTTLNRFPEIKSSFELLTLKHLLNFPYFYFALVSDEINKAKRDYQSRVYRHRHNNNELKKSMCRLLNKGLDSRKDGELYVTARKQ